MTTTLVTPEIAVKNLIAGIRRIPADFVAIGHSSNDPAERQAMAKIMIDNAIALADQIELAGIDQAVEIVRLNANQFANLDPRGWYIGNWAHVAVMVHGDNRSRYVMQDGVLGSYFNESAYQAALKNGTA